MIRTPKEFAPLLQSLVETFRRPATARRVVLFFAVAILTVGDRTVSNVLRLLSLIEKVNPSTYHRLFTSSVGIAATRLLDRQVCPRSIRSLWYRASVWR